MSDPVLTVSHLRHSFPDGPVVADVSFAVEAGEHVTIVGPSGCGKSTLLRLVSGLTTRQHGEILVSDEAVTGPGPDRVLVLQEDSLFPWRSAAQNVEFGLAAAGLVRSERKQKAASLLAQVGLERSGHLFPSQLSSGMRQRCELARAFAVEPGLLLLDEPMSALDWQARREFQDFLQTVRVAVGQTTLLVTHDIDEALYLSDRILVMSPRPAKVMEEFVVDLPRPRTMSVRDSSEYLGLRRQILTALGFGSAPTRH